jgi:hypothetical protein
VSDMNPKWPEAFAGVTRRKKITVRFTYTHKWVVAWKHFTDRDIMFLDGVDELGSDGKQDGFWTRDSSDACCFNDKVPGAEGARSVAAERRRGDPTPISLVRLVSAEFLVLRKTECRRGW